MIHEDKKIFLDIINIVAQKTGFQPFLIEKDYYLSIILSKVKELSEDLIFKGGTCLNKIYYEYYRLSEDLDFSMKLPQYSATRGERRKCIQPVKDKINDFVEQFDLKVDDAGNPGRNESKQYVYYFVYQSALRPLTGKIKFEIGLRFNPIESTESRDFKHVFLNPFTNAPLFDGNQVHCLSLMEIVSEKMRAAAIRQTIAPRDFYDLDFILRNGFKMADKKLMRLFKKKLLEDDGDPDLKKYKVNLGRSEKEIKDMRSRIEPELFDVLTPAERKNFDLDVALKSINKEMGKVLT